MLATGCVALISFQKLLLCLIIIAENDIAFRRKNKGGVLSCKGTRKRKARVKFRWEGEEEVENGKREGAVA